MTIPKQSSLRPPVIMIFICAVVLLMALVIRGAQYPAFASWTRVGDFTIGTSAPFVPGEKLAHPHRTVPASRFYVYAWQPGLPTCVYEECGDGGAIVATLRGWLWGADFDDFARERYHLPPLTSLIIVADRDSIITGIYPDARISDIPRILKKHPKLADFGILTGIHRLGALEVGAPLPFMPIDGTRKNPKFYFLIVHETVKEFPYCPYYECGTHIDLINRLGGSFHSFDHESPEIINQLGLSPDRVARGEATVVVMADAEARIVAIHPDKDMRDTLTILSQHPELTDVEALTRPPEK